MIHTETTSLCQTKDQLLGPGDGSGRFHTCNVSLDQIKKSVLHLEKSSSFHSCLISNDILFIFGCRCVSALVTVAASGADRGTQICDADPCVGNASALH